MLPGCTPGRDVFLARPARSDAAANAGSADHTLIQATFTPAEQLCRATASFWHATQCQRFNVHYQPTNLQPVQALLQWSERAQDGDRAVYLPHDALWEGLEPIITPHATALAIVPERPGVRSGIALLSLRAAPGLRDLLATWAQYARYLDAQEVLADLLAQTPGCAMELDSAFYYHGAVARKPQGPVIVRSWRGQAPRCVLNGLRSRLAELRNQSA